MPARNVKTITPVIDFKARKIGIVARDYNVRYPNGYRDFSHVLPDVLKLLDEKGCDVALFSLYSIIPRQDYNILPTLAGYTNLKMVCLEEFRDSRTGRKAGHYVVYFKTPAGWEEWRFLQAFGRVNWQTEINDVRKFTQRQLPKRILGSCCILVCGESNGVKYNPKEGKNITDPCRLLAAIPPSVEVILNPVHDKMARFEMMMKRRFLSQDGRWVVSIWNKGKRDKNGRVKDGSGPPWTIYHSGELKKAVTIENFLDVQIGIVSINEPFESIPD